MDLINKLKENAVVKQWAEAWANLSKGRRMLFGLVAFVLAAGLSWGIVSGTSIDYRALTNVGTDLQHVASVREALEKAGTPYRIGEGGVIEVPAEHYHRARLDLGMGGLMTEGVMGNVRGDELFDEQDSFFVSTAQVEINQRRALEGELSRTVSALDEVRAARVHLVVPKRSLFKDPSRLPSASVVVQLKPAATLSVRRVRGLQKLVASAVEGLDENRVSVMDSTGAILTRDTSEEGIAGQGQRLEMQRAVERDLEQRVISMLEPMAGPGRVIARATVNMDFTATEKTVEEYDQERAAIRSQRTITENRGSSKPQAAGVPGARGNSQGGDGPDLSEETAERTDELTNYDLPRTVTHHSAPAGRIQRISVAVVLDGSQRTVTIGGEGKEGAEKGQEEDAYVPFSEEELHKFDTLVKSAIGYDVRRGDRVHVTNMPFAGVGEEILVEQPLLPPSLMRRILDWAFVMALVLTAWFLLLRPLLRRRATQSAEVLALAAASDGSAMIASGATDEAMAELSPAEQAAARVADDTPQLAAASAEDGSEATSRVPAQLAQNLRARAIELSRSNAGRSAQVIRAWLQAEE